MLTSIPVPPRSNAISRIVRSAFALLAVCLLSVAWFRAAAQDAGGGGEKKSADSLVEDGVTIKRIGVLFASASDDPGVKAPVEGGKKTVLAAGYEWDYGIRLFTAKKWRTLGGDWEAFLKVAAKEADRIIESIEPVIYRSRRGIIEYAELTSDDPFLSSVLLSKKLIPKFEQDLGPRINAVIVDRYRIYLFPADAGKLEAFGTALADAYRETEQPVSLEVFLIDRDGARVIGEIGE